MTKAIELLHSIDWDFNHTTINMGVHAIHPYPAKFIPQIPKQLIELFHMGDSSIVLDPFCGSGTTLVEAMIKGIDAWGIDLNPLACLISRVKTTSLPTEIIETAQQIVGRAQENLSKNEITVPSIPRLDHWFKPDVQRAISSLVQQIDQLNRIQIREAFQVALSNIIVTVSNQESNTRYAAIEKDVSAKDVFVRFEKAATTINRAISECSDNIFNKHGRVTILNQDILEVTAEDLPKNIGLVVTSPPYPNAYEYWLYHKYRMYWLGMDPIAVRQREIGARPHYFKTNHQDERDFERQMSATFNLLSQVMKPGAKACFLVGRSIIHGRNIDNVALLKRAAEPHGFVVQSVIERHIPATRKSFNPVHGKINEEHLIIFSNRKRL